MSEISDNARGWLRALSAAEGTTRNGEVRYDIMFGGGRFNDLSRHPDTVIDGGRYKSAAAGAYQFMPGTWDRVSRALNLNDFGPSSQDQAALQLMRWRGVDPDTAPVNAQNVALLAPEWASLPKLNGKSYYDQPVKSLEFVQRAAGAPVVFASSEQAPMDPPIRDQVSASPETGTDNPMNSGSSNLDQVVKAISLLSPMLQAQGSSLDTVARAGKAILDSNPFAQEDANNPKEKELDKLRYALGNQLTQLMQQGSKQIGNARQSAAQAFQTGR